MSQEDINTAINEYILSIQDKTIPNPPITCPTDTYSLMNFTCKDPPLSFSRTVTSTENITTDKKIFTTKITTGENLLDFQYTTTEEYQKVIINSNLATITQQSIECKFLKDFIINGIGTFTEEISKSAYQGPETCLVYIKQTCTDTKDCIYGTCIKVPCGWWGKWCEWCPLPTCKTYDCSYCSRWYFPWIPATDDTTYKENIPTKITIKELITKSTLRCTVSYIQPPIITKTIRISKKNGEPLIFYISDISITNNNYYEWSSYTTTFSNNLTISKDDVKKLLTSLTASINSTLSQVILEIIVTIELSQPNIEVITKI